MFKGILGKTFTPSGMGASSTPLGINNGLNGGLGRGKVVTTAAAKKKLASVPSSGYGQLGGTFQQGKKPSGAKEK